MRLEILVCMGVAIMGSGCAAASPASFEAVASDVYGAWEAEHGPAGERCDAELSELSLEVVPRYDLAESCGRAGGNDYLLDACYWPQQARIVIAAAQEHDEDLMRHELTHWLLDCTGEHTGGDPNHRNQVWW